MNRLRRIPVLLTLCCLAIAGGWTQRCAAQLPPPPQAQFISPANNATNISVSPTIQIRTNLPIVASSVFSSGADAAHDPDPIRPTITLVPKIVADSLPDSIMTFTAIGGTTTMLNDTTLVFTPAVNLTKGAAYVARVSGLKVRRQGFTGSFDTLDVPQTQIGFTTVLPGYMLVATSVPAIMPRSGERLWVRYNRHLPGATMPGGAILTVERVDSITRVSGTLVTEHTSTVTSATWLEPLDNGVISVLPTTPLKPGGQYYLVVHGSYLTGNSIDDKRIPFQVPEFYTLTLATTATTSPTSVPGSYLFPGPGVTYPSCRDTVTIAAVEEDSTYTFLHWRCPQDASIDSSTSSVLKVWQPCSTMKNLEITAVYIRRDSITVTVGNATGIRVVVYDSDLDSIGAAGSYRVARNDMLWVAAVTNDTTTFGEWSSTDARTDGSGRQLVGVKNHGLNNSLYPLASAPGGGNPDPEDVPYSVCGELRWGDPGREEATVLAAAVTLHNATGQTNCDETGFDPATGCLTAHVEDDCYQIIGYEIHEPGKAPEIETVTPTDELEVCALSHRLPPTKIVFIIEPVAQHTLTVYTVINNQVNGEIGPDKDVTIAVFASYNSSTVLVGKTTSGVNTFSIDCDRAVTMAPFGNIRRDGFPFVNWQSTAGWQYRGNPGFRIGDMPDSSFRFTITGNTQVKGFFNEDFVVRRIGFHLQDQFNPSSPDANITWVLPRQLKVLTDNGHGIPFRDVDITHWRTRKLGAFAYIEFSHPVNKTSAEGRLFAKDESPRIDQGVLRQYHIADSAVWSNGDKQVRLALPGITKGETFSVTIAGVQNTASAVLANQMSFKAETEMPGVIVKVKKVTPLSRMGDWFDAPVEMFSPATATQFDQAGQVITRGYVRLPDGSCYDNLAPNVTMTYDATIHTVMKMGRNDRIGLNVITFDNDNEADCPDFDDVPGEAATELLVAALTGIMVAAFMGAFILGVTGTLTLVQASILGELAAGVSMYMLAFVETIVRSSFVRLIGACVEGMGDGHDFMGDANWNFGFDNDFFGSAPHVIPNLTVTNKDVRYEVDFQLKTDDLP